MSATTPASTKQGTAARRAAAHRRRFSAAASKPRPARARINANAHVLKAEELPASTASPIYVRKPGTFLKTMPAPSMPTRGGSGTSVFFAMSETRRPPSTPATKTHSSAKTGPFGAAAAPIESQSVRTTSPTQTNSHRAAGSCVLSFCAAVSSSSFAFVIFASMALLLINPAVSTHPYGCCCNGCRLSCTTHVISWLCEEPS